MLMIVKYKSNRSPSPNLERLGDDAARYQTAPEARAKAEEMAKAFTRNGYNGENDYFWGWNDGDPKIYYFSVQPDPISSIIGGATDAFR